MYIILLFSGSFTKSNQEIRATMMKSDVLTNADPLALYEIKLPPTNPLWRQDEATKCEVLPPIYDVCFLDKVTASAPEINDGDSKRLPTYDEYLKENSVSENGVSVYKVGANGTIDVRYGSERQVESDIEEQVESDNSGSGENKTEGQIESDNSKTKTEMRH